MKRIRRVVLCGILAFSLLFSANATAYASEEYHSDVHHLIKNGSNEVTYLVDKGLSPKSNSVNAVSQCGRYATHDMLSRGHGTIRRSNGKSIVNMGACHQCTRCHLVLICEGEPEITPIGYYATYMAGEPVSYITVLTTDTIHYTSATTIPGMDFRY